MQLQAAAAIAATVPTILLLTCLGSLAHSYSFFLRLLGIPLLSSPLCSFHYYLNALFPSLSFRLLHSYCNRREEDGVEWRREAGHDEEVATGRFGTIFSTNAPHDVASVCCSLSQSIAVSVASLNNSACLFLLASSCHGTFPCFHSHHSLPQP